MSVKDKDDFRRTAETMMVDARTLRESGGHRNACYIAGYVVECTLKALLVAARRQPETTHDLVVLLEEVATLSLAAGQGVARYGDPLRFAPTITYQYEQPEMSRGRRRHFCDWNPNHRYDGRRWTEPAKSSAYLKEAEQALDIMNRMFLDGVVR